MQSVRELKVEIQEREAQRQSIRNDVNQFCREIYGIQDFFGLADSFFPQDESFVLGLARQVPTANVEHVACHLLAQWLAEAMGVEVVTLPLSLVKDRYVGSNSYKKSLVKLPWLRRGRKSGQLVVNHENVVFGGNITERCALGELTTTSGERLPSYHLGLRERVLGPNVVVELSPFFQQLLMESLRSGRGPRTAYQNIDGRERVVSPKSDMENLRPPAEWVYLFHLMLFLDGRRALLSTVGDNDEVSGWFVEAIQTIQEVAGVPPLIVNTPVAVEVGGYKSNLLEYVGCVLEDGWQKRVVMPQVDPCLSVFQVVESLERQIIELA